MTDFADLGITPLGTIMPMLPGGVPEDWLPFDGLVILREEYPDLWDILQGGIDLILPYWEKMGGTITEDEIVLPDLDSKQASIFAGIPIGEDGSITLAIKAQRTRIDEDASESSQIHSDDPNQGRPR